MKAKCICDKQKLECWSVGVLGLMTDYSDLCWIDRDIMYICTCHYVCQ